MTSTLPITDDELPALFAGLEGTPLALAVSGGADSMALMNMIARWAARADVQAKWDERRHSPHGAAEGCRVAAAAQPPSWLAGATALDELRRTGGPPPVVVLTIDHGLRPEAADEAAFVAREAGKLGLPCGVLRWEGEKPATGIQVAAREARRALLCEAVHAESEWLELVLRRAVRTLVMAHHLEDQAETFLMRLARGSGLDGLGGMHARDTITREPTPTRPSHRSAPLVRPLLGMPKARLVATLCAYGARWIDDPSNDDDRFERVRLRKALRQLEPLGFTAEKIALSARRLADADMSFVRLLREAGVGEPTNPTHGMFDDIDLERSDFASHYTATRLLRRTMDMYGGAARRAELAQIEHFASLTVAAESRLRIVGVTLGGCRLQPQGSDMRYLRIFREGNGEGLPRLLVAPGQSVDWDGTRFTVDAGPIAPASAVVRALGMQGWADLKRAVKGLGDLGWPAAAVATLPVVECGGEIIAYPVIDRAVRSLPDDKRQIKERWAEFANRLRGADYHVTFNERPW